MTYRTDQFVKLIKAPIVCNVNGDTLSFTNGEEFAAHDFVKRFFIKSIIVEGGKAVLNLTEKPTQNINSDRDDFAARVEWMIELKERFGVAPNLFDGV